jgi:hypothetical protein
MKILVQEADPIPFDSDEEIDDIFVCKQYAKSYFQRQGKKALLGDNFESNILLDLDYGIYDIYNILKRGKTKKDEEIESYSKILFSVFSKEKIMQLIHLCRICGQTGDPAFPELIAIDGKKAKFYYVYTGESRRNQFLFFYLAKMLGFDFRFLYLEPKNAKEKKKVEIDVIKILGEILSDRKIRNFFEYFTAKIEELLEKMENDSHDTRILRDDLNSMKKEKEKSAFFLFSKWQKNNEVRIDELLDYFNNLENLVKESDNEFKKMIDGIKNDPGYRSLGIAKDDETIRKKFRYSMEKLGINEEKAKNLITFIEFL